MTKLNDESCRWAIQSLRKVRHNDLFPRPFEFEVIAHFSDDVVNHFSQIDIGGYRWDGGRRALIPKEMISFRQGIQLDPIDSLFLSAIIHQFGPKIEKARFSVEENVVFSYRFDPNDNDFYDTDFGWSKFWEKSKEKAETGNKWVVSADIASYYSQIYHPRVKDQLLRVQLPTEVVESIMKLLGSLTHGVPRGIPVGPRSVHLLAECAFHPIDKSLRSKRYDYCRYIDDIHIFCKTQEEAFTTLFDLANILYNQQMFTLQRHKTKVIPADKFIEIANRKVEDLPSNESEKDIKGVIDSHSANPYDDVDLKKLTSEELAPFDQNSTSTF